VCTSTQCDGVGFYFPISPRAHTHTCARTRVCCYVCGRQCLRNAFSFFTLFLGISFRLLLHDSIHNAYPPIYFDITCVSACTNVIFTLTRTYIYNTHDILLCTTTYIILYYRNTGRRATVLSQTNRFHLVRGIVFIYNKMYIIYRATTRV